MCVAEPYVDEQGLTSALADSGFGEPPVRIYGEDSWQAVELAMQFCLQSLRNHLAKGWQFYWPDSGEELSADELGGSVTQ